MKEGITRHYVDDKADKELTGNIGFGRVVEVDKQAKKKILVTGAGSYIGDAFAKYAKMHYEGNFRIDVIDMVGDSWRKKDFSEYDIVYHVAGIAHADVGDVSDETKEKYYKINTDLAVETAKKAKMAGVQEFVFMSSMIVYGDSAPYGKEKIIDAHTVPVPANFYGDSKLQADVAVRELAEDGFKVIVLRPPLIYGRGSKGNYPILARFAKKLPVFPNVNNERSMLYIDNLCELLCQVMLIKDLKQNATVLLPQNTEWTNTADMVKKIAKVSGKKIAVLRGMRLVAFIGGKMPGKIGELVNKAFGNSCYAHELSIYPGINYQKVSLSESIIRTEGNAEGEINFKRHILVVSQYFYPEQFRVNDICQEWVKRGHKVTVLTGIPNYPKGDFYDGYDYTHKRKETWNGIDIIRLPIKPRKTGVMRLALNYMSFVTEGRKWIRKTNVNADSVFIYEVSPMTQALVGVWYAQRHHVKCNLYVTDLWPENVEIALNVHNKLFLGAIGIMVDYIYKRCNHIFTSSKSFIDKIEARGVNKIKLSYWPQYAEDFYRKVPKGELLEIPKDETLNLTFAGNIGTAQGLDVLVSVAVRLKEERIKIRFNIIGNGRYENDLKEHAKRDDVEDYFNFIPQRPAEMIPKYFAWSDAALITLSRSEIYALTIPAKTQSCLACGIPVLVSADGEVQNIIKDADCGFCSDSGDALGLADNIKRFIAVGDEERERLSINALVYFKENFDKKVLMDRMEAYI
jgi:nucleoside-diphosphate-sugar epimerase/glycosyltransferase involved in cell wall biosynthesis